MRYTYRISPHTCSFKNKYNIKRSLPILHIFKETLLFPSEVLSCYLFPQVEWKVKK